MSEHGKWQSNNDGGGVFITMSDGCPVFVAEALGATKEIKVKRARLIAAVPDLLAACENAVKQMEDDPLQGVGEWQRGLFCGLEDRGIDDIYEACQYGYNKALDKVQEWIIDEIVEAIDKANKET